MRLNYKINVPIGAKKILTKLHASGFEAYVVGGCVRDSLLGLEPKEWDICTSAIPREVEYVLDDCEIIPTGVKHGTVTAVISDEMYEITTFRSDGDYCDNRHPSSVAFVNNLKEDLARRDFTINTMAYSEETGVIDYYHGREDLANGVISCVRAPNDRLSEDALRIMRALRFASTYDFAIDNATAQSIHRNKDALKNIAVERIQKELLMMLSGDGVLDVLLNYSDVITTIIPELAPCVGFQQNNKYHQYTVYDHIAHTVANYKGKDSSIKMALLLHDIGKPRCYTEDVNGGHFHGHGAISQKMAKQVMNRLHFDNRTKTEVLELVLYHDSVIEPTIKTARKWLNKIGEQRLKQLIKVKFADIAAHADGTQSSRVERYRQLDVLVHEVIEQEQCFSIKNLKINGNDIMALGIPQGKEVGNILSHLLDDVLSGDLENTHDALVKKVVTICPYLSQSKSFSGLAQSTESRSSTTG